MVEALSQIKIADSSSIRKFPGNPGLGFSFSTLQFDGGIDERSDWGRNVPPAQRAGSACEHFSRYEEHYDLAKDLGSKTIREEFPWCMVVLGVNDNGRLIFDDEAIKHYATRFRAIKERGMNACLTATHFTNPAWLAARGGWLNPKTPNYFNQFIKRIVPEVIDNVDMWVTINEPSTYVLCAYLMEFFPHFKKSLPAGLQAYWNLARAHKQAYETIHTVYDEQNRTRPPHCQKVARVGIVNQMVAYRGAHKTSLIKTPLNASLNMLGDFINNSFYLLSGGLKTQDYQGINYYMGLDTRWALRGGPIKTEQIGGLVTDTDWGFYPEGLYHILKKASRHNKPISIMENGIATTDEELRNRYFVSHLYQVIRAMEEGVKVENYWPWALLDNMELHAGYRPKFGLYEVDFATQKKTPRPIVEIIKLIFTGGGIPEELISRYCCAS